MPYAAAGKWTVGPETPFEKGLGQLFLEFNSSRTLKVAQIEMGQAGVVQQVKVDLSSFRKAYNRQQDPRAVFTQAYETITEIVLAKVQDPERGFGHAIWLAALDNTFAQYYFKALEAYDQAKAKALPAHDPNNPTDEASAIWQNVPELWKIVFDTIGVGEPALTFPPKATVLERLILPLLVHMMHDLPLAVAELAVEEAKFLKAVAKDPTSPEVIKRAMQEAQISGFACQEVAALRDAGTDIRDVQQYAPDYEKINDLLFEADYAVIDAVQKATLCYSRFLQPWLDSLTGRQDEIVTSNAIQLIRGKAWYEATRLVEASSIEEGEAIRRSIEEDTKALIKMFHDPASQVRRALLKCARVVSGLFQTWPEDSP